MNQEVTLKSTMRYSVDESDALVRRKSSSLKRESNGGWEGGAVGAAAAPAHDSSVSSIGIDSMDSITSTANQLKDLMVLHIPHFAILQFGSRSPQYFNHLLILILTFDRKSLTKGSACPTMKYR